MRERCDKIIDCPNDSSDEENCGMIVFDTTYKKGFAPIQKTEDKNLIKTKISVSVELLNILRIDEVDSIFSCQIDLHLSWLDQRLLYNNLKTNASQNTLSEKEKSNIWTPRIIFLNTDTRDGLIRDENAQATVTSNGIFILASDHTLDNTLRFKGSENFLQLTRTYKGKIHVDPVILMMHFTLSELCLQL